MVKLIRSVKNFQNTPLQKVWDNDGDQILAFVRKDLLFVFNFSPNKSFTDYGILVPKGEYEVALNTDDTQFGGFGLNDDSVHHSPSSTLSIKRRKRVVKALSSRPFSRCVAQGEKCCECTKSRRALFQNDNENKDRKKTKASTTKSVAAKGSKKVTKKQN